MTHRTEIGATEIDPNAIPSHTVFLVKSVKGKAQFEKVGLLFPHADSKGFNQHLEFHDWDISLLIRKNN